MKSIKVIFSLALLLMLAPVSQAQAIYSTHEDGMRLGTIDSGTGAGTDVGAFGTSGTWAAAFGPDGTLYTIFNGFSGAGATLASVDPSTGAITPIGSVGTNMISLEVACDGTMYGVGYNDAMLYSIDKATGATTPIGNTGIGFTMDLAIDSAGTLYSTASNRLWTLDTGSGAATVVTDFTGALGQVMGIMFDENDVLYATDYTSGSPLYTIDIGTGVATAVGNTGFNRPHGGDFLPACDGACCTNGPGTESDCVITTKDQCESEDGLFLGSDTECANELNCTELLVTFESLSAVATEQGVRIAWTTLREVDTVGFRVLRETAGSRTKTLDVVAAMVPSAGHGLMGASYEFLDDSKQSIHALSYYIEDLDVYGKVTRHGPITVLRGSGDGGGRHLSTRKSR